MSSHSYAAGAVSGIAMISALIWLRESHPLLVDEEGNQIRRRVVQPKEISTDNGRKCELINHFIYCLVHNDLEKKVVVSPPRPRITSLMIMCFINEFCVKWSLNAFESRYGIYVSDRWNVSSPVFS